MEKPRSQPAPAPRLGQDLDLVVHRCPFCREGLRGELPQVSCAACNARHHQACWDEHAACASCGATDRLVPERTPPRAHRRGAAAAATALLAGVLAALVAGALMRYRAAARDDAVRTVARADAAAAAARQAAAIQDTLGLRLEERGGALRVLTVDPDGRVGRDVRPGDELLAVAELEVDAFNTYHPVATRAALLELLEALDGRVHHLGLRIRRAGVERDVSVRRRR